MPREQMQLSDVGRFHAAPTLKQYNSEHWDWVKCRTEFGSKLKVSQSKSTDSKLWMLSFSIKSY